MYVMQQWISITYMLPPKILNSIFLVSINISEITNLFTSNVAMMRASILCAVLTLCPGLVPLRREKVKQLSVNEDLDINYSLLSIQIFFFFSIQIFKS